MSWDTQAWAAKQRPHSSSCKLLLLALASCADADHCAYPSVAWLTDFTDLNRKTVIATLDRLTELGLIVDTGERKGRTKQVKVYRLTADRRAEDAPTEQSQKRDSIPKSGRLKSPNIGGKESQKRDTEPFKEPNSQKATPSSSARAKPKNTGPLPEGWVPEACSEGSKSQAIIDSWDADRIECEIEKFKAHHSARDNRFSSWQQAWITWVLNSTQMAGGKTNAAAGNRAGHHTRDNRDGFERALDRSGGFGAGSAASQTGNDRCRAAKPAIVSVRTGTLL